MVLKTNFRSFWEWWFYTCFTVFWSFEYLLIHQFEHNWGMAWDFQQCGMCDQQRLRPLVQPAHTRSLIRAFASRLISLWLLSYWLNIFGVSKLRRSLHRLVWVYTYQNATLLEITCHSSYVFGAQNNRLIWEPTTYVLVEKNTKKYIFYYNIHSDSLLSGALDDLYLR